eukprot:2028945-Pleurochrysis_carterae.AAC.1
MASAEDDERRKLTLTAASRREAFGQDTSKLYHAPGMVRKTRAEFPLTTEQRRAGSNAVVDGQNRLPLDSLQLR